MFAIVAFLFCYNVFQYAFPSKNFYPTQHSIQNSPSVHAHWLTSSCNVLCHLFIVNEELRVNIRDPNRKARTKQDV